MAKLVLSQGFSSWGWKGEGLLVPGQAWGSRWPDAK